MQLISGVSTPTTTPTQEVKDLRGTLIHHSSKLIERARTTQG